MSATKDTNVIDSTHYNITWVPNATPLQNAQSQRNFRLDEIERASYKYLEIKDYYQLNENPS